MSRTLLAALMMVLLTATMATAEVNAVTPSTNEINEINGWAHFTVDDVRIGEADVTFSTVRNFASCFEYRSDGAASTDPRDNFNSGVTDGLWDYVCVNGSGTSTVSLSIEADEYLEIRSVFGAERDERFDWTRVDVLPDAQTKDDCKKGGWETYGFDNQGQCIRFVNTGQDSRA